MKMKQTDRLERLALVYRRPEDCASCRAWGPVAFAFDDAEARPETCPACGRRVPIRLLRRYVGVGAEDV